MAEVQSDMKIGNRYAKSGAVLGNLIRHVLIQSQKFSQKDKVKKKAKEVTEKMIEYKDYASDKFDTYLEEAKKIEIPSLTQYFDL